MKKPFRLSALLAAVLAVFVFLLAETVVVKIKSTVIRKDPKFYASTVATLAAGAPLEKLASKDGWLQVRTRDGLTGWVHSSAVADKKFSLSAMDKNLKTQASSDEVALASKGFNKDVEASYRARHAEANFAAVDRMERLRVLPSIVEEFLRKGRLGEFGGAR